MRTIKQLKSVHSEAVPSVQLFKQMWTAFFWNGLRISISGQKMIFNIDCNTDNYIRNKIIIALSGLLEPDAIMVT